MKIVGDKLKRRFAYNENGDITQNDVISAYDTLKKLENKYVNNIDELNRLTNYLLNKFKNI